MNNFYNLNIDKLETYRSKHPLKEENEIKKFDILAKTLPPYQFWIVDKTYKKVIVDSNILIIRLHKYSPVDLWIELQKNSNRLLDSSNGAFVKYIKKANLLELDVTSFTKKENLLNQKKIDLLEKIDKLNKNLEKEIELNKHMFNSIIKGDKNE